MGKPEIEGGCVLLARRIKDSSLNKMRSNDFKVAINLLAIAHYKDVKWYDQSQHVEIVIRRGDAKTTQRELAEQCCMTRKVLVTSLRRLLEHGFIEDITPKAAKRGHAYSLYHIRKYEYYQDFMNYVVPHEHNGGSSTGPRPVIDGATSSKQVNKSKQEKKGDAPSFPELSTSPEETSASCFLEAWQILHCRRWETADEYLLSGFEKRDLRVLVTPEKLETYIAYAYHYHHDDGVGIEPGEKAPTIDNFLNKAVPRYCSTLREGTEEWAAAIGFAREFLEEKAAG